MYDVGGYWLRLYRRIVFRNRPRLTYTRLKSREQQKIAVMVPAWNEGDVLGAMVKNILERVDYKNYMVFVGVYPNDAATIRAVDALAARHPEVIKVVNPRPGPTTKADCLNIVYHTISEFERRHNVNFDIIVMHDAEDVVHPQSFALYNYLIPRVDVIQLPILALPSPWYKFVHWTYADEFAENHLKDVPVREKLSGFVPFAGVGTGFSRRAFEILEQNYGRELFNESSMTEDYSMSKKMREAGLHVIFVNLTLKNGHKYPWYMPLSKRQGFVSNWAYFPMDFVRAVRQKTRWIIGISLQEWEHGGWSGDTSMKENLVKDRKVFVAAATSLIGYFILIYFLLQAFAVRGWINMPVMTVVAQGSLLSKIIIVDTIIMCVRMFQRVVFVSMVYGLPAGLLSIIRLPVGNVINGVAAFRALQAFSRERQGKGAVRWDKTMHEEGVGTIPSESDHDVEVFIRGELKSFGTLIDMLNSGITSEIVNGIDSIPRDLPPREKNVMMAMLKELMSSKESDVRAVLAKTLGFLRWDGSVDMLMHLIDDQEWVVRANSAKALLKMPFIGEIVEQVYNQGDRYGREVMTKAIEQDFITQRRLLEEMRRPEFVDLRLRIFGDSPLLENAYLDMMEPDRKKKPRIADFRPLSDGPTEGLAGA